MPSPKKITRESVQAPSEYSSALKKKNDQKTNQQGGSVTQDMEYKAMVLRVMNQGSVSEKVRTLTELFQKYFRSIVIEEYLPCWVTLRSF